MINKPLVLIIDDSQVNLMLLYNILEQKDFRVISARNGEDGLALAKKNKPDIILLDIVMGGWDGYETCYRIKQDNDLIKIPVLFLSALGETENKVRAFKAGGVDYVSKPFQKDELLARVETQLELAYLRQNLEREVVNQTEKIQLLFEALKLSYDKAQQASILKTEFLRNISHEFRTPMNIVLGMTEILIDDTGLTEEQLDCADTVMQAGKRLMDILTNMLNFSQQFKGELKEVISDFHIHEMIDNVLKELSVTTVQISTEIEPSLKALLRGNQEDLSKVLSQLLENAIKFTHKGKIVIEVQPIEGVDERRWVQFEIRDTGIGIAKDKQAHLFDIFFQIDGSSTRAYEGLGMGLAVAKMFIENMGGQIGVESIKDIGSTFWFNVPLEQDF
ncbi:MAG: response regulator [Thiomargarita sp.]|nr:response regulator [Thiomargarita sp.]